MSFEAEKSCLFEIPMRNGGVVHADERPLRAFGTVITKRDRRTTTYADKDVAPIGRDLEVAWETCAEWRDLDSRPLGGSQFPHWDVLMPQDWTSSTQFVFVYLFWGWCEPCMVSLKKVSTLTTPAASSRLKILIIAMDGGNPMWQRAFERHGVMEGPSWHVAYLPERSFMQLSSELKRGHKLGFAVLTDQEGCILHTDVCVRIAETVTRRVIAAGERCDDVARSGSAPTPAPARTVPAPSAGTPARRGGT